MRIMRGNAADDITGFRSGNLVAIEKSDVKRKGSALWRCRCDCGNEIYLEAYKIRNGLAKSCGCARKMKGAKDLKGQRFGKLIAIERTAEKKENCYLWRCICDCGKEAFVPTSSLVNGNTTSCGCARKEALQQRAVNISGVKYGRLLAVKPLGERRHGSVVWECVCDCGKIVKASYNSLVSGNTKSCGCLKKEHAAPPLRYVDGTCIEMLETKTLRQDNTSGYTGVVKTKSGWHAQIGFKGKMHHMGTYSQKEKAIKERKKAEEALFDSFLSRYYENQE